MLCVYRFRLCKKLLEASAIRNCHRHCANRKWSWNAHMNRVNESFSFGFMTIYWSHGTTKNWRLHFMFCVEFIGCFVIVVDEIQSFVCSHWCHKNPELNHRTQMNVNRNEQKNSQVAATVVWSKQCNYLVITKLFISDGNYDGYLV